MIQQPGPFHVFKGNRCCIGRSGRIGGLSATVAQVRGFPCSCRPMKGHGKCGCVNTRYVLAFLCFFGLAIVYLLRINLNVTILSMTSSADLQSESCPQERNRYSSELPKKGEFDWSEYQQGVILGAFFYGYVVSNFLAGVVAERLGGKILFGGSIFVTSLLTLLTPMAARNSTTAIIALRVFEGLAEGMSLPALHTLCSAWLPKTERSFVYSVIHSGAAFGTVIGYPLSGFLSQSSFLGGWPSAFYLPGSMGLLWFVAWWLLISETPSEHPRISSKERLYIINNTESHGKRADIPWVRILTSRPLWAIAVTSTLFHWGIQSMSVDLPTFLSTILHFNIKTDSLLSSIPHVMNVLVQWSGGFLSGFLVSRNILGVTSARKSMNLLACLLTSSAFLGVIFSGCNRIWVMTWIVVGTGALGLAVPSLTVALFDLSPQHAGTLMGLTNGFSNIASCLTPYVIGALTNQNNTLSAWHTVFYMSSGFILLAGLVFAVFGSSDLQPWAPSPRQAETSDEKEETHPVYVIYLSSL